jgi:uncharacterized protein (DUF1800 family)
MASLNPNTAVLGTKNARHLLRRATFKYTKTLIDQYASLTPQQALDLLVTNSPLTTQLPYDPSITTTPDGYWTEVSDPNVFSTSTTRKKIIVSGWWWYNAINSETLKFKLSHFLSTRFTIEKSSSVGTSTDFYDYIRLLNFYAYGNYKELAKKMTLNNAMLVYLNNTSNSKTAPNENYAREFLELFTIGKGPQIGIGNYTTYTESDVVQAARVLTGFKRQGDRLNIDAATGIPRGYNLFSQHHLSPKVFSNAFQNTTIVSATTASEMDSELDLFVNMVFNQQTTAKNIVRKLYIYFVKGNITTEVETDIISPLATELYANGYEILPIVRKLLESLHFYDLDDSNALDENIGAIIKSPLQQVSEICSYLQITMPDVNGTEANKYDFYIRFYRNFIHDSFMASSNMLVFDPENVAGHLAYYQAPEYDKSWIASSTIIARYRLGESLLDARNRISGNTNIYAQIQISLVIKNSGIVSNPNDPFILVSELCKNLFAQEPDTDRVNYFMNSYLLQGLATGYWYTAWANYLSTNNNSVVEPRLKELVKNLLRSPESQIF